jgi:hypothetical protein
MIRLRLLAIAVLVVALSRSASPQDHGFVGIMAVFPSGGAVGTTVEVDLRPRRRGVVDVTVSGPGITATLLRPKEEPREYDWQPDRGYPLFQNKCNGCHALPNPVVLRYTREEWQKIVERMVKKNGAPITLGDMSEGSFIAQYLGKATQQATGLRARFVIAPEAPPGLREVRMIGKDWSSQAGVFEITTDREVLEAGTNTQFEKAQPLTVPVTVSGQLNEAREIDYYALDVRRGQRITIQCASFSGNDWHLFPRLRLLDAAGNAIDRNEGHNGFAPLLDFTPPADGRYFIAVDDLFSRGSSEMVYRLKIGERPYDAALFPAGVRRGESIRATLVGENAQCPPVMLTAAKEDQPGIRKAKTVRGELPFMIGEYPEVLRSLEGPAPRLSLPATLNGRFIRPDQRDLFLIDVTPEEVGKPFSIEVVGGRIGSPAEARIVLVEGDRIRNDKTPLLHSEQKPIPYSGKLDTNWPAFKLGAQLYGRDERFDVEFPRPGTYALEVSDVNGRSGSGYVYRIQIGPAEPDFSVAITPDNAIVRPGSSIYLELHPLRRHLVNEPIEVTFPELPAGITASPGMIRPGHGRSFLVLSAAPDAKPGMALRTRPVAVTSVAGKKMTRPVIPYEFRDHCRPTLLRDELLITVGPAPSWTVQLEAASPAIRPGQSVEIKVKLDRREAKEGDVPFFIFADHKDVRFSGLPTIPAGANESVIKASLSSKAVVDGPVQIVVVNGLNEWIGVTSGAINRSSAPLLLATETQRSTQR